MDATMFPDSSNPHEHRKTQDYYYASFLAASKTPAKLPPDNFRYVLFQLRLPNGLRQRVSVPPGDGLALPEPPAIWSCVPGLSRIANEASCLR